MEYNQIPKTGTIGGMVDNINANFQLTKEMLERLEVTKDHAVGLFSTLATLQAAYPSPEVGDWALVGDTTPFAIYKCTTAGTWSDTGGTYDGGEVNLSEYAKKAFVDSLASTVSSEASRLRTDEAWLQRVDNDNMANGRQITTLGSQLTDMKTVDDRQDSDIEGIKEDLRNLNPVFIEGDVTNNPDNVFLTSVNDEITPKERTTSLSAKGHYIMRPTDNFAAKLKANYIHEIPFDVNLGGASVTIPANAVLKFTGGKISGGALVLQNTYLDGDVKLSADVAVSGTIANKRIPFEWFASLDHMASCCSNLTGFSEVHLAPGEHTQTVGFAFNDLDGISIYGHGAIINANVQMPFSINGDTSEIALSVSIQPVGIGSRSVVVSDASSFAVGDIVALVDTTPQSFSRWRNAYCQGEFKTIQAINGTTITFTEPIYGYYIHDDAIYITKRHLTKVGEISGLSISNDYASYSYGIHIKNAIGATISGINVRDAQTGISISNCIAIGVRDSLCVCYKKPSGDSYGISIGNSQNIVIDNCVCAGGNHGISSGGAALPINLPIVCRFLTIQNCNLRTFDSTNASIWFHGNIEFGTVQNCVARTIAAAGNHCRIIGNTVMSDSTYIAQLSAFTELTGYDHIIADNTVIDGGITAFGPLLEPLYASSTLYTDNERTCDEVIRIENNVVELKTKTDFILYGGAPGDTRTNHEGEQLQAYTPTAYARKVRITGNTFKSKYYGFSNNYAIFTNAAAHDVDILVADNYFGIPVFRLDDTRQTITFERNIFKYSVASLFNTINGIGEVTFRDNTFDYRGVQRFRAFAVHSNAASDVAIGKLAYIGNTFNIKHISSNNFVVDVSKGVTGELRFVENKINAFDSTAGSETAGVLVGANAAITTLYIRDNRCLCGTIMADLRHSISGTITNFNYSDELYLESMWSAATITTKTIYNKVYSGGWSSNTLLTKSGSGLDGFTAGAAKSGFTSKRPTLAATDIGFAYFDTTLHKPIFWNGSAWVDAAGTTV